MMRLRLDYLEEDFLAKDIQDSVLLLPDPVFGGLQPR